MSKASVYKVKRQIKQNENYVPLISQRANFLSMQTANKLTRKKANNPREKWIKDMNRL